MQSKSTCKRSGEKEFLARERSNSLRRVWSCKREPCGTWCSGSRGQRAALPAPFLRARAGHHCTATKVHPSSASSGPKRAGAHLVVGRHARNGDILKEDTTTMVNLRPRSQTGCGSARRWVLAGGQALVKRWDSGGGGSAPFAAVAMVAARKPRGRYACCACVAQHENRNDISF